MSDHFPPDPKPPSGRRSHQPRRPGQRPKPPGGPGQEWVTLGNIVGLFGLHGNLKVAPQTDIPNRFTHLGEVFLGPQHQRHRIASAHPYKGDMLLLHLAGIETANDAQALVGLSLAVPLAQIAPLPPDQYYIHDLIGLRVETPGGQMLGTIKDILPTGGHDVYVVSQQGSGREVLVPAVKEMVKQVDIAAGTVIIDPIPGLFDEHFEEAE